MITRPKPSIGFAYNLAAEDETHKQITTGRKPRMEAVAFKMTTQRGDADNNFKKNTKREPVRYDHCRRLYHTKENFYELIGYQLKSKFKKDTTTELQRKAGL